MKGLVLAAGWPFAGLLALDAGRSGTSGTAPVRGFIAESDDQSGLCVLKSGEVIGPLAIDAMTRCYGVRVMRQAARIQQKKWPAG